MLDTYDTMFITTKQFREFIKERSIMHELLQGLHTSDEAPPEERLQQVEKLRQNAERALNELHQVTVQWPTPLQK